jgi:hypothetical protein
MKARDIAFLAAALLLLSGVAMVVWKQPVAASAGTFALDPDPAAAAPSGEAAPAVPIAAEAAPVVAAEPRTEAPAASGRRHGAIRGHIALSADVVSTLRFVHVRIQEAHAGSDDGDHVPFMTTLREDIGPNLGTPEFYCDGVPFSVFGYTVSVLAEGMNGSQQFVQVNEGRKVADVTLSVTAPTPFTVLLRDQLLNPVPSQQVFMVPVGEPRGRPMLTKEADSFGAAVFAAVLQGDYEIRVGAVNEPIANPQRITVIAHAGARSTTIEVPIGFDLTVLAQAAGGWGVKDVVITAYATDTKRYRKYEGTSDYSGKVVFAHLPPGEYQLNASPEGFERWSKKVKVAEQGPGEPVIAQLIPRR